jgi:hypothetical protein
VSSGIPWSSASTGCASGARSPLTQTCCAAAHAGTCQLERTNIAIGNRLLLDPRSHDLLFLRDFRNVEIGRVGLRSAPYVSGSDTHPAKILSSFFAVSMAGDSE